MTRHFLVVGAQRCGTTYLRALLDAHPQIAMARPERPEPKVFVSDDLSRRGVEWYRSTFFRHATESQILGDKSTSYLEDGAAAKRAADMLGAAHIVVQLRDPVARAVSNWRFSTANGLEARPLSEALEENLLASREWAGVATSVSPYAYLERGRYAEYLEPWIAQFAGKVHVLFLEEVTTDPGPLRSLFEGLGVDPDVEPPDITRPPNASEGEIPPVSASLEARIQAYFNDSDVALERLVGRPLPWRRAENHGKR